jgi:hypothetical protein
MEVILETRLDIYSVAAHVILSVIIKTLLDDIIILQAIAAMDERHPLDI